jgi:transcriptional regulator with XRE-family HTH domain
MSSTARKKSTKKMQRLVAEMPLQELRQARELSQEKLAKLLDTKQANISRLEQRTDMYISTLRAYIEAMGGTLEIIAHFPNGDVRVNQFREI